MARVRTNSANSLPLKLGLSAFAILALVAMLLWLNPSWRRTLWGGTGNQGYAHLETTPAERKPFLLKVDDSGHIASRANVTLASAVEGSATIIFIVPEGTKVEAGDLVCELEATELINMQKQQEIAVNDAQSLVDQGVKAIEIQTAENESLLAAANLAVTLAELDLTSYEEGEFPQTRSQLTGQVALRQEELVRAQEQLEFTRRLVNKGLRPQNEMEARRLAVQQAEQNLSSAEGELLVLEEFTERRQMAELQANAEEFVRERLRVILAGEAMIAQLQTELSSLQTKLELEQHTLQRYNEQIEACTLVAPQAGEVVYANQDGGWRGNDDDVIRERGTVQNLQDIIHLPDNTQLKIDCNLHESMVSVLRVGLPVRIRLAARPGEIFDGVVHSVSSVAQTGDWRNPDKREYAVEIYMTDPPERLSQLRPGLSANVEIIVDSRQNILQVPVQCVVGVGREHLAWVLENGEPQRRTLTVGMSNTSHIEIIDGIGEGELVVQNPRTNFSVEIAAREEELSAKDDQDAANQAEINMPSATEQPGQDGGRGPRGGRGQGGEQAGGADAGGDAVAEGGEAAGGQPAEEGGYPFAAAFVQSDADSDGKLSETEIDERLKPAFAQIDANGDGGVDEAELTAHFQAQFGAGEGGQGAGGAPTE